MSLLVTATGTCMCSMGTAPAPIKVTSQTKALAGGKPCATVQDAQPMANVGPFGMCTSLANPQVAAATAAALGVLTPQPCIPATATGWMSPPILSGSSASITKPKTGRRKYGSTR